MEELELGEQSRTAIKAREGSRKKASAMKKRKRKYKALAAKEGEDGAEVGVEESEDGAEGRTTGGDGSRPENNG